MIRRILEHARRDAHNVTKNVISMVVVVGIIVVPCFYAWFNVAASWNPYDNTKNLKVAVANSDEGYSSDLLPVSVNMGERITTDLQSSDSIGYVVTDEEDAVEGVRSGKYYAAIVFPEDFSRDMMTVLSQDATTPTVTFYQNQKQNSIAAIVTDKASTAVQQDVEESFSESVTNVGASVLGELGDYMNDDQVKSFATKLESAVSGSSDSLRATAADVRSFSTQLGNAKSLLSSSSSGFDSSLSSTLDAANLLSDASSSVRDLGSTLSGTTDSFNKAIASGAASLDSVNTAVSGAFDKTGAATDKAIDALQQAQAIAAAQAAQLQELAERVAALSQMAQQLEQSFPEGSVQYGVAHEIRLTIDALRVRVEQAQSDLAELSQALQTSVDHLGSAKDGAIASRDELLAMVEKAQKSMADIRGDAESELSSSLATLADDIDASASEASGVSDDLRSTLSSVDATATAASGNLGDAQGSLADAATTLEAAAQRLESLHSKLSQALASDDVDTVRAVLSSDPEALASFISNPVTVDRNAVYKADNNGTAMAPFYTTLAIWIGGVILAALVKVRPSEEARERIGGGPATSYLGRIVFFVVIGLAQATLIVGGDLCFLGIQCEHPALLILVGWVSSIVFVNIIYALTASFGDVGKAIAVFLMVIQVAGSGGSFPKEMLPGFFQTLYPFLPFVHAENAMRAAIFGLYGNDWLVELGTLALYLVPALLLGLLLRKPVIRANEWFEERLEETRLI